MALRTLIVGLCALTFASPAAAHTFERPKQMNLHQTIAFQERVVAHDRRVIRFFEKHRWMLARYNKFRPAATRALAFHERELKETRAELAVNRRKLALRHPRAAICHVFKRHCRQALSVARCESNFSTSAQNGQYLGMFQMGRHERARYGHGRTALAQAQAAHRYFVAVGYSWRPWECKPRRSWI